eukprot:m.169660 g.169660  ORF g.169660 m.169660 type:complete len:375 (-) comp31580_c1_seq1:196-1320(-)
MSDNLGGGDGNESDELPGYDDYAEVKENVPNMTIQIRRIDKESKSIRVANIDSVEQIKSRIKKEFHISDGESIELRQSLSSTLLSNNSSLAQLRITDGSTLDLCVVDADGNVKAPTGDGKFEVVKVSVRKSSLNGDNVDDDDDDQAPPEYSMLDIFRGRDRPNDTTLTPAQRRWSWFFYAMAVLFSVAIFIALPTCLVVVGSLNLQRCPSQPKVPIWMITFGAMYLFGYFLERVVDRMKKRIETRLRRQPEFEVMPSSSMQAEIATEFKKRFRRIEQCDHLIQTFLCIWFVIGTVWVFTCSGCSSDFDAPHNNNSTLPWGIGTDTATGCDVHAYKFAFVLIVLCYVAVALPIFLLLIYVCIHCTAYRGQNGRQT